MSGRVRIATRKSALALWQARHVATLLEAQHPGLNVELLPMSTRGDRLLGTPLSKIGGKGLFLKELEHALIAGEADIAVHSMKDVPVEVTPELGIAAVLERADASDAWVSPGGATVEALEPGAVVGTSSLRRRCQLLALRPDLQVVDLRGNVNTRLEKLDAGQYQAIILATAGLQRLGLEQRITCQLPPPKWVPSPNQGIIGVQCRLNDEQTIKLLAPLEHQPTRQVSDAERSLSRRLGGSCRLPLGAWAEISGDGKLFLHALVGSSDGQTVIRAEASSPANDPEAAARSAAEALLEQGAAALIAAELEADS